MKIRTRLIILFTLTTAIILMLFATVIYLSAKKNREKEFYSLLEKEAVTKANLFLNAHVDKNVLQDIYHNNRKILNEVEVAIYDTHFELLYHDAVDIDFVKETRPLMDEISRKGAVEFYQKDWQVVGLRYEYNGKQFIITAAAYDQYGYSKLNSLLTNIIIVFIASVLIIIIIGIFFSRKAFQPVSEMIEKAKNITATNLDLRLSSNESSDELSELANTFNEMLNRLESSFDAQKHFVSNISHELRTPLSALIAELELSVDKERAAEEYKMAILNALKDAKKISRLSGSLLDFAKASYDLSEIKFKNTRIDEVLLDARQQVQKADPDYRVDIHFENDFDDDNQISVNGNEYLLKVAFVNLFENGCKFSADKESIVYVSFGKGKITLRFTDKGVGISPNDLENIFRPFYRGENKKFAEGNGIGISLTHKIITLHKGTISVFSKVGRGTTFTVELPAVV
ncbi:sensor histidine kinase [Chryseobacterium koreense]|uniref:histidine kinase n=1 Tax=Chryseobacterium koreense CCUG 49689 TaxID=1304281 RepID=A0A0J7IXM2_9FLAO|nr:ATP-binding protein [Chryseobacterium koreense]KMQ70737.1 histidine kinase [Chryseobacterium koreense CCUG 49689]MBB5333627.1 signal transduction histidine kinase [Chryseobacterium koreense]